MQLRQSAEAHAAPNEDVPADLHRAGAVIDKAIDYMLGQNVPALSIASALLGGALGLLSRTLDDRAIVQVLNNAIAGVQAGDLHRGEEPHPMSGSGPRLAPPSCN